MKVRNIRNPEKIIDVDALHYANVLKEQGWEAVGKEPVIEIAKESMNENVGVATLLSGPPKSVKKKASPKKKAKPRIKLKSIYKKNDEVL